MIALIDYDAGHIRSVGNALARLGAEYELTADPARIAAADKVILPGVGNAAKAMESLQERGLCEVIRNLRVPALGISVIEAPGAKCPRCWKQTVEADAETGLCPRCAAVVAKL